MDLSVIIVNWNSISFTMPCIASIQATTHKLDYEVIVVDNASHDNAGSILSETFPSVRFIGSNRNLGFAGANNLGAEYSLGRNLLFLNPDTLVLDSAIDTMVARLDSAAEIGALGCRILNGDLTLQITCVQVFPTIANQLLGLDWLKRRWPSIPIWGIRAVVSENSAMHEVEVVSGACLMVKRQVFEKVGRFSTEYFMYAEEADLCQQIRRHGWKVCHTADVQVIHFGGQSTKIRENGFVDTMMRESVFKLLRKFRGSTYAQIYRRSLLVSALVRLLLLLPMLALPNGLFDREAVLRAFKKWRNIAAWSSSLRQPNTAANTSNLAPIER
jgi:GT2 family glycosyltransferase